MPGMYINPTGPPMPGPARTGTPPAGYSGGMPWNVKNSVGGKPLPGPAQGGPRGSVFSTLPAKTTVPASSPNVLGPQSIRPTGPSGGFDPQYLQNLATAIGGLFSRPGGSLNFNPLGNLSDIKSPGLGVGNAPLPGLPSTMLQDAINGLAFMFNQPSASTGGGSPSGGGGGDRNNNGGGRKAFLA